MPHRHRIPTYRSHVLPLEPRRLMCVDVLNAEDMGHALGTFPAASEAAVHESAESASLQVAGEVAAAAVETAALLPLTDVPALNSRPGAAAKLYLDFDGDVTANWGASQPGTTPAFDRDNDPLSFSDAEITAIREIFQRVAEKFSPFNLNVTTVNPETFNDRSAGSVVVGGTGTWFGGGGGVAFVGGFYNGASNTCFVFSKNLSGGSPKAVAEAIGHEAGHTYGLQHQALWTGTTLTTAYYSGTSAKAPVMGNSYGAARGLWWRGTPSDSSTATQDDLTVLSGPGPAFGYRADDHPGANASATSLAPLPEMPRAQRTGTGVIERPTDVDVFSFTTGAGPVAIDVRPAVFGPMLDLTAELRDANGAVVATAATASLAETVSATLPAGTYYLHVKSAGEYGDVGQYTVSGTVAEAVVPTLPVEPTDLRVTPVSRAAVRLNWTDASDNEDGFRVYRSTDGTSWTRVATLGPGSTAYTATWLRNQAYYQFEVTAFNAVGESATYAYGSVLAGAWQPPSAPATATQPAATTRVSAADSTLQPEYASRVRRLLDLVAARRATA